MVHTLLYARYEHYLISSYYGMLNNFSISRLSRQSIHKVLTTDPPFGEDIKKHKIMAVTTVKQTKDSAVKQRIQDIQMLVSWREIAHTYFGKSASWLYHKLDGIDGNGGVGGFTEEEKIMLRDALCEVSNRIRVAADRI